MKASLKYQGDSPLRTFDSPNMDMLHQKICHTLLMAPKADLDHWNSVDVQLHNTISRARSMEWSLDLKDLWLTAARWSTLVRQYLDREQCEFFLDNCSVIGLRRRGVAMLRTNTVLPRRAGNGKVTRRWGSCMLAVSYKAVPRPQVTLYSRTSYLGYIGALDMSVAWQLGRYIAQINGIDMHDLSFVWYNELMQFHGFKSLAYVFNYEEQASKIVRARKLGPKTQAVVDDRPALRLARNWLQKVIREYEQEGKKYGDEKYNTFLRIVRRYHTEVLGYDFAKQFESMGTNKTEQGKIKAAYKPLPSVAIEDLDLRKMGLPALTDVDPDQFEGDGEEGEDEDGDD